MANPLIYVLAGGALVYAVTRRKKAAVPMDTERMATELDKIWPAGTPQTEFGVVREDRWSAVFRVYAPDTWNLESGPQPTLAFVIENDKGEKITEVVTRYSSVFPPRDVVAREAARAWGPEYEVGEE